MLSSPEERHTLNNTKLEWVPDVSIFHLCFCLCWVFIACAQAFSGCCEEGLLFLAILGGSQREWLFLWSTGSRSPYLLICSTRAQYCGPWA